MNVPVEVIEEEEAHEEAHSETEETVTTAIVAELTDTNVMTEIIETKETEVM